MKRTWTGLAILVLVLSGLALVWWREERAATAPGNQPPPSATPPPASSLVTTARPVLRTFSRSIPWIGVVESKATVPVTALVDGRIRKIEVEGPARVAAGRILARLGGPRVDAKRARLAAEVGALEDEGALARQTTARLQESLRVQLATRDQVAAAQKEQIALETRLRDARLARDAFEEGLRITAPVAGVFTRRRVGVGEEVSAGTAIGDIVDVDHLHVVASVFPPAGVDLKGKEARVRRDETEPIAGRVTQVLPEAAATGATRVWIEGPEIDEELRPGQTVGGRMVVEVRSGALAIPTSAVVYDAEEHPIVFVRDKGGYASRRVRLGLEQDGWTEVADGVGRDDVVVTRGAYELFSRRFGQHFKVPD